jgi:transcriptional regulator with XRE-family HTH domain
MIDTPRNRKRLPDSSFYLDLGRNIRLTRSAAGKSQSEVAEHLDLTFQQVQKYENGKNRIPVDRLVVLSDFLDVPLAHFVRQAGGATGDAAVQLLIEQFESKEFQALLKSWNAIADRRMRGAILDFVKSMAALNN